jgi:hypothetical protein
MLIVGWFLQSAKFFALPLEVKQKVPHPPEGWNHRGYSEVGVEQVSQMVFDKAELSALRLKAPDFKESFDSGNESGVRAKNIWLPGESLSLPPSSSVLEMLSFFLRRRRPSRFPSVHHLFLQGVSGDPDEGSPRSCDWHAGRRGRLLRRVPFAGGQSASPASLP